MKQHVKLFEEFILSSSAEELSLRKQFATSAVTAAIPNAITHDVSKIVHDESGTHVEVGNKSQISAIVIAPEN
jgi:hypothetical protein